VTFGQRVVDLDTFKNIWSRDIFAMFDYERRFDAITPAPQDEGGDNGDGSKGGNHSNLNNPLPWIIIVGLLIVVAYAYFHRSRPPSQRPNQPARPDPFVSALYSYLPQPQAPQDNQDRYAPRKTRRSPGKSKEKRTYSSLSPEEAEYRRRLLE
jgi:hypothetical protein